MTVASFLVLFPLFLALTSAQRDEPEPSVQRMVAEEQWIVRVPVRARPAVQRFEWTAGQGYKCVRTNAIRGAFLAGPDSVDFVLRRQRVRATLGGNCTALDFYDGFYLKTGDERVCAQRDFVHSRMGGSCRIERFQRLVPKLKN